jgi:hypothetical protein
MLAEDRDQPISLLIGALAERLWIEVKTGPIRCDIPLSSRETFGTSRTSDCSCFCFSPREALFLLLVPLLLVPGLEIGRSYKVHGFEERIRVRFRSGTPVIFRTRDCNWDTELLSIALRRETYIV